MNFGEVLTKALEKGRLEKESKMSEGEEKKTEAVPEQTASQSRISKLEALVANVQVSDTFKSVKLQGKDEPLGSPAGDAALEFLDKQFSVIEEYLELKLKEGFVKNLVMRQLPVLYLMLRVAVERALS